MTLVVTTAIAVVIIITVLIFMFLKHKRNENYCKERILIIESFENTGIVMTEDTHLYQSLKLGDMLSKDNKKTFIIVDDMLRNHKSWGVEQGIKQLRPDSDKFKFKVYTKIECHSIIGCNVYRIDGAVSREYKKLKRGIFINYNIIKEQ